MSKNNQSRHSKRSSKACRVCRGTRVSTVYKGRIRSGKFGNYSSSNKNIQECQKCCVRFLASSSNITSHYYKSGKYREKYNDAATVGEYFRQHDADQSRNLGLLGSEIFRNKVIADIGTGGGSFLDLVKGYASRSIAVEPSEQYRKSLAKRSYSVFPFVDDAAKEWKGKVDVATTFSVLEHISDPLGFLKGIGSLLSKNGHLYLTTPSYEDVLMEMLPDVYSSFFYRDVHLWYFNPESLKNILHRAGFIDVQIVPFHRFSLSNFILWLKEGRPTGKRKMEFVSDGLDVLWKSELCRQGRADYLLAIAKKRRSR